MKKKKKHFKFARIIFHKLLREFTFLTLINIQKKKKLDKLYTSSRDPKEISPYGDEYT